MSLIGFVVLVLASGWGGCGARFMIEGLIALKRRAALASRPP